MNSSETEVTVIAADGPDDGRFGRVIIESDNGYLVGIGTDVWQYFPLVAAEDVSPRSGQNGTEVSIDLRGILDTQTIQSVTLVGRAAEVVAVKNRWGGRNAIES